MQQKDRRIGCHRINLVDRWQALLGKLMFGKAADDADPLGSGSDRQMALQHFRGVSQRMDSASAG